MIGAHQLRLLIMMGSPTRTLVTRDRISESLVRRGLLREDGGGGYVITAAGLRTLADEMDAGRIKDALTAIRDGRKSAKA